MRPMVLAALIGVLSSVGGAHAWQRRLPNAYYVFEGTLAAGADGAIFIDAGRRIPSRSRAIAIEKRDRRGERLWRNGLRDGSRRRAAEVLYDMAVTPEGDVVGAGSWNVVSDLVVFRMAGRDGRRLWTYTATGSDRRNGEQAANSVAIDSHSDVIAGGTLEDGADERVGDVVLHRTKQTLFVTKLAAHTGGTLWAYRIAHTEKTADAFVHRVAVDAEDDVLVLAKITTGHGEFFQPRTASAVLKLDGATGAERWRLVLPDDVHMRVMALAPGGGIFVAGYRSDRTSFETDVVVSAVDAAGQLRWTRPVPTANPRAWEDAYALLSTTDGDAVVGGVMRDPTEVSQFTVVRLDAATGDERWRTVIPSTNGFDGGGGVSSLALGPDGTIVAGGGLSTPEQCSDVAVVSLASETGAVRQTTTIDGTTTATSCFLDQDCDRLPCGDPRAGIDRDRLWSMRVTPDGRVVVTGETSDGPKGTGHGFLASWPLR